MVTSSDPVPGLGQAPGAGPQTLRATGDLQWLHSRMEAGGLTAPGAGLAARHMARAVEELTRIEGVDPDAPAAAFFVPGRIELLGKHVDYAGGRSLVTAVERGFSIVSVPFAGREGPRRAESPGFCFLSSGPGPPERRMHRMAPGEASGGLGWRRYPEAVGNAFTRACRASGYDLGGGAAVAFSSSLEAASGLSSSSALIVALHLALAGCYGLDEADAVGRVGLPPNDGTLVSLAARLAAVERGDEHGPGVGTEGGSQDHAAVLLSRRGQITRLGYRPLQLEGRAPLPAGWTLAVGVSGVRAAKAAGAREAYNRLSREASEAARLWPGAPEGAAHLGAVLAGDPRTSPWGADALHGRIRQFREECGEIVPAVFSLLEGGRLEAAEVEELGRRVDRSQSLAETVLRNQVPETVALARHARMHGAAAASAFGAGFGGAVWALVPEPEAFSFLRAWRTAYLADFPRRERGGVFFLAPPGPGAFRVA